MIRACAGIVEARAEDWLRAWDEMPVGELQFICQDLRGIVPQRNALGGMVFERLYRRFGPAQLELFDGKEPA